MTDLKNGADILGPMRGKVQFSDDYWDAFRKRGPRHRNVARWLLDLKWGIRERAMREYLAPELKGMH